MSAEIETQGDALQQLGDKIAAALSGAVHKVTVAFGELTLDVEAARITDVVTHLRDDAESYRGELDQSLRDFSDRSRVYARILYLDGRGRTICRG